MSMLALRSFQISAGTYCSFAAKLSLYGRHRRIMQTDRDRIIIKYIMTSDPKTLLGG